MIVRRENMRVTHNEQFAKYLNGKHKIIYILGAANGLRVSDVVQLRKDRITMNRPTIKEQKSGKSKRLYIPAAIRADLKQYAEQSPNEYVFYSTKSKSGHITRQAVWGAFKRAAKRANITVNIGTHTMRKNYAQKWYGKAHNLKKLKSKLNHSNESDSVLYLL